MAAPRRKYTNEMKLNAVHLVQNEGRSSMPSTSFKMRDVEPAMSLTNSALTATPSTPGCAMLATVNSPLMILPARSRPSRLKFLACELSSRAPVRSVRC